jgi:S1-C subfamily serine protease
MFVDSIKKLKKTMFPIFRKDINSPGQQTIGVVGTGFFINKNGYFISVAHLFDNPNQNTSYVYWGQLPDKITNPPLVIKEIAKDNSNDIFIGKVDLETSNYLKVSEKLPDIGKSVCIAGYPLAQLSKNQNGGAELGGVRRYFQPSFVLDKAKVKSDNGSGVIRDHVGFLIRDPILFGMSGGPIVGINGTVVGVQGSITQPRISQNGNRSISVENGMAIETKQITKLLKKKKIKFSIA